MTVNDENTRPIEEDVEEFVIDEEAFPKFILIRADTAGNLIYDTNIASKEEVLRLLTIIYAYQSKEIDIMNDISPLGGYYN